MKFDKILVPVDFSKCSGEALDYALALARRLGSSIEVLHAYEIPPFVPPESVLVLGEVEASLVHHAEAEARRGLKAFLADHGASNLESEVQLGPPGLVVLERLERADIDLVVMGTHGRTGL